MKCNKNEPIKPFLRWAGGKTRSIPFLEKCLPPKFSTLNKYYEPFLGAGSLFFHLRASKSFLSDKNRDLIECYKAIKKSPEIVSRHLQKHLKKTSEEYYYEMRKKYNNISYSISKAALFIYLNKTCFNGIWRVNSRGQFNVPYGHKEHPSLPTEKELLNVSRALSKAGLLCLDYKDAVKFAKENDFVYFDPPYPPLNGTSFFTHYTKERFTKEDHYELAQIAKELTEKGCYVLISNSDTKYIRSLYKEGFSISELEVTRWIRADGKRYKVKEIAITNYDFVFRKPMKGEKLDKYEESMRLK